VDLHIVTEAFQVPGAGETRGPGANHQHALPAIRRLTGGLPAVLKCEIAEETLHRVDADGAIDAGAVTAALAGVVADAAVDGGHRVIFYQRLPGLLVALLLGQRQPCLNIFTCGTGVIAGGK